MIIIYSLPRFSFSDHGLPSPHGLDTTLPDTTSFPYADDSITSPNDYSCATTTTGGTTNSRATPDPLSGGGDGGFDERDRCSDSAAGPHIAALRYYYYC